MKHNTFNQSQLFFLRLVRFRTLFVALVLVILFSDSGFSAPCVPGVGYAKFDFDRDCKADYVVYRTVGNQWWVRYSNGGNPTVCPATGCTVSLGGGGGNQPVPADYNGDGRSDVGYFTPTGTWLAVYFIPFSSAADLWWSGSAGNNEIPQPADFDGDHTDELVYYLPATGDWKVKKMNGAVIPVAPLGGQVGDKPVVGDYDGDTIADPAIVRTITPGVYEWNIRQSNTPIPVLTILWGLATDIPVPADYDGDGKTDLAIFRPADNNWWIRNSSTGAVTVQAWGNSSLGDIPIPADYNGDGRDEPAIYRPLAANSQWWTSTMLSGPIAYLGSATDEPAPHCYIP